MKKPQYDKGAPLKLEELSPEQLQYLQESGMGKISTDPRYKDAQLAALQAMEERSKTGLTAQDEADMYKLQRNVSTQNRGRMGAIQNNMAVRGMSGSGMDALMQMQANQDATDREALAAMEKAGQAQNAKMSATQQLGQMGGQMRSQDFNEQSAKAQAQDAINRFNTSTRNDVFVRNNQTQNQGTTQNWNRGNEVSDKNTEASYAHDLQQENERRIRDAEARRRKGATAGMIGGIVGGAAGSYFGPTGTAAGYGVGSQIGQTISGYAYGGDVQPNLDDPANDVVPAVLSPGEHVIPRSAMSSEQMFQDYTDRLKESIRARQGKVDDAESNVKNAQYGSIFANALNDFSKGNRKDTVLLNNVLKDPSGKPTVIQGEYNQIKDTWSEPAQAELARQDKGLSQDKADFGQSENMRNYLDDKKRKQVDQSQDDWKFGQEQNKAKANEDLMARESDPASPESKLAQSLASKMSPKFDFSAMSAKQINERLPNLTAIYKIEQEKLNRQDALKSREMEFSSRAGERASIKAEKDALGTAGQQTARGFGKRLEDANAVFDKLTEKGYDRSDVTSGIGSMLPNLIRSSDGQMQDQAERNFVNALLRKESGAAISPAEFASAEMQYFPRAGDAPQVLAQKKANRERVVDSLKVESGKTWDSGKVNPEGNDLINGLQLPDDQEAASQARQRRIMELKAKAGK